jgi:8-oxo-dGTP diphosphatase
MIAEKLTEPVFWVLAAAALLNITQRRHQKHCEKKRISTLILAALIFAFYVIVILISAFEQVSDIFLIPGAALIAIAVYILRDKTLPYTLKCTSCGTKLDYNRILYFDSNMCADCDPLEEEESNAKPSFLQKLLKPAGIPEPEKEEETLVIPDTVDEVDWGNWKFTEQAVICYIKDDNQLLLINKKKGLGAGKVNAPGGRIEPGEMPVEATIRECREEVGLTPVEPEYAADLFFIFKNGRSLRSFVFTADAYEGEPVETDEADPFWCSVDNLPLDKMWADDELWLPRILKGEKLSGRFIFDDDEMLSSKVEIKE